MNDLIGNTPIIKIKYKCGGQIKYIYAKLEWYSLTGSIKDRIVSYIIKKNKLLGNIKNNQVLVEATSGNTGISLSAIGNFYKHKVVIFMPDFLSEERINLMRNFGADVRLISEGGFKKCLSLAEEYSKNNNGFLLNQFSSLDNVLCHYETTGLEITNKVSNINGFVSGVGSGGTLMGVSKRLKEYNPNIIIGCLEPKNSPLINKTLLGERHKIEGISDDFIPSIFDKEYVDRYFLIDDNDAINMSKKLAKELGLGVGISSGANLLAGILLSEIVDNVVVIFPDDNKKYLSTDLSKEINVNNNYISNSIELIGYEVV